jgi:hypothetical protein
MRRAAVAVVVIGIALGTNPCVASASENRTQTISYAGYEITVPSSWPVYWLARDPAQCVRYDIHAVYLGTPGPDQQCPPGLVGRTETVSIATPTVVQSAATGRTLVQPGLNGGRVLRSVPGIKAAMILNDDSHQIRVALRSTGTSIVTATYGSTPESMVSILASLRQAPSVAPPDEQVFRVVGSSEEVTLPDGTVDVRVAPTVVTDPVVVGRPFPAPRPATAPRAPAARSLAAARSSAAARALVTASPSAPAFQSALARTSGRRSARPAGRSPRTARPSPSAGPSLAARPSGSARPSVTAGPSASAGPSGKSRATVTGQAPTRARVRGLVQPTLPGFDTCTAPSLRAMRAWRSKYAVAGIYIGGSNMACDYGNLSAGWVRTVTSTGWGLLPVYVGLQAPCYGYGQMIKPGKAAAEGQAAAEDAVDDATTFGLPQWSPIYYDMEAYNENNRRCVGAVLSFLSAWTKELNTLRYFSGVYSSADSGVQDLQSAAVSGTVSEPQAIWFALWDGQRSLTDAPVIEQQPWLVTDRVKQYSGGHWQKIGGISLDIDSDLVGGLVAR